MPTAREGQHDLVFLLRQQHLEFAEGGHWSLTAMVDNEAKPLGRDFWKCHEVEGLAERVRRNALLTGDLAPLVAFVDLQLVTLRRAHSPAAAAEVEADFIKAAGLLKIDFEPVAAKLLFGGFLWPALCCPAVGAAVEVVIDDAVYRLLKPLWIVH